jgi:recombination associated protein RdgC
LSLSTWLVKATNIGNNGHLLGGSMWFKNLRLYRLTKPFQLSAEQLSEKLESQAFYECPRMQPFSLGWAAPLGQLGQQLVHAANGCMLLCARREEKILPAGVIRDLVKEKVFMLEEERQRKISRREKAQIRDEILQDLMPRALCRSTRTFAYIVPQEGWIVIDVGNQSRAEEFLALLRKSLGSLAVVPLTVNQSPAAIMSRWLAERRIPQGFELGGDCVLKDVDDANGNVRCRNQDLLSLEIAGHLQAGKQVVKLALEWAGILSLVLDEDMSIKRLRFSDVMRERAADIVDGDEVARFDNDFVLMTLELARFIPELLRQFGGVDEAASPVEQSGDLVAA